MAFRFLKRITHKLNGEVDAPLAILQGGARLFGSASSRAVQSLLSVGSVESLLKLLDHWADKSGVSGVGYLGVRNALLYEACRLRDFYVWSEQSQELNYYGKRHCVGHFNK